jgi:RNA polymerase sigma-70 factor (ECF subfamily)
LPDRTWATEREVAATDDRRERFEAMYRQHEHAVLAYALRRAPAEPAKDAAAEAFLVAWRRFDELPADPLPWLVATTRRTLANQRRSAGRQAILAERLAHERPDHDVRAAEEDELVRAAFARLGAADRELLALVAWDGLTPAQAARSLGCTPVALRVRLHRARRRLAKGLAALEDGAGARNHPGSAVVTEPVR